MLGIVFDGHIMRIDRKNVHLSIIAVLLLIVFEGTNLRQYFMRRSLKGTLVDDHHS